MNSELEIISQWCVLEIKLVSDHAYANPYKEITIVTYFFFPQGQKIIREAFWCGGDLWKVRFAPPSIGKWTWNSKCSDALNKGLHNHNGEIICKAYEGTLPIYKHGFVRISDNKRHFAHADGTPFFWLGDTHWQMPNTERVDVCNHPDHGAKACPHGGQFQHLVDDRKVKGFTVYQTYPAASSTEWWSSKYTEINPQRFESVFDVQIGHLANQGFVIGLGFGHFNDSMIIPVDELRGWARYLVARYGAYPIVWLTCQEMNAPEDKGQNLIAAWKAVAEEIALTDGYGHPHSGHQWVYDVATSPLGGEHWHDWFALQGGHLNSRLTPQARYAGYYNFFPTKPMVETEAMYEAVDCGGVADSNDARKSAWKAMLCGCAGYTYGAGGIWALKWDASDTRWKDYNHQIESWHAGMALLGSVQMSILKYFFISLPWMALTPRFTDPAWSTWEDPDRSTILATVDNSLYLAYCHGKTSKGKLKQLALGGTYEVRWFNPQIGAYKGNPFLIKPIKSEWDIPEMPSTEDWVLLLTRQT